MDVLSKREQKIPKSVGIWLLVGLFMVFMQVIIGGITRLTDSGLSITNWELISGVLPPMSAGAWQEAFELYKTHAKTQYEAIHSDMTLSEFKFIYFWEYFHRLWARSMGFVFLFPFIYFWRKKYLPKPLVKKLGIAVGIAGLAAVFGWIMVKSGLNTPKYMWVNAYKLTIHLCIAFALFGYLVWIILQVWQPKVEDDHNRRLQKYSRRILIIVAIQIVFGGLMSGMKAGLVAPYFPHMGQMPDGSWVWVAEVLKDREQWNFASLVDYNQNAFAPSLVQLFHRGIAFLLCVLIPVFYSILNKMEISKPLRYASKFMMGALILQVVLGILTLIYCVGKVPAFLGVLHQGGALLLLAAIITVSYQFGKGGFFLQKTS